MYLQETGHDITIHDPDKPMPIKVFATTDSTVTKVDGPEADVLVFQRVTNLVHAQAIPLLRQAGYAVVMDADDDFTCIHPHNKAFNSLHPRSRTPHSWEYNRVAASGVTLMTVSTDALVNVYGRPGRCVVLDNYIPAVYLTMGHVDSPTFGWPGSVETHPDDLLVTGFAAQRLEQEGYNFLQAGPYEEEVARQLGLTRMKATGACEMRYWASTVARLGVGWAPLTDTRFNRSKSRLKCLEMNAVHVPYVASPLPEYARMTAAGGGGILAEKPKQWYRYTKDLITNPALRRELGEKGHTYASTQTAEQHAWRWMEAWQYAYDIEHGAPLAGTKTVVDAVR
jgi:hypothetical protein